MRACLQSRGVLSSEVGTSLTGDGERSALVTLKNNYIRLTSY